VPHDLIFAANSHHEDPEVEENVQRALSKVLAATSAGQHKGGNTLKERANSKAQAFWDSNCDLRPKMQILGLADSTAKK
jgi:hypothetical protein